MSLVRPHLEYACPVWAPHTAKNIHTLESVQKFAFKMATHNWNASYQELQSLINIPTLERRRLELKLCHLFKIVHNLCYFPQTRSESGNRLLQSAELDLFTNSVCNNHMLIRTHISTLLYHMQFRTGTPYHRNL